MDIKKGDIYWCKMHLSDEKLSFVPKGHQVRPYIVIEVTEDRVYCYPCYSLKKKRDNYHGYSLPKKDYSFYNDTYVATRKLYWIGFDKIYNKLGSLKEKEMHEIDRRREIMKTGRSYTAVGDVIIYNHNKYFVYSENNDSFNIYKIVSEGDGVLVKVSDIDNYLDISVNCKTIPKNNRYWIVNIATISETIIILKVIKSLINKEKNYIKNEEIGFEKKEPIAGSIFKMDGIEFVYLFKRNDNYCCAISDIILPDPKIYTFKNIPDEVEMIDENRFMRVLDSFMEKYYQRPPEIKELYFSKR